jgi:hypothetical protein
VRVIAFSTALPFARAAFTRGNRERRNTPPIAERQPHQAKQRFTWWAFVFKGVMLPQLIIKWVVRPSAVEAQWATGSCASEAFVIKISC